MSTTHPLSLSTSIEPLDSASPSSPPPGTRQHVFYPPTPRIDFIVHFGQTDFHCHTFVLHIHSTYFRHVFEALTPSAPTLLLPPPLLPPSPDATRGEAKAVLHLSPVSSPTSSPVSPPQPVWRSMLASASSYVHSALQRLTTQAERSRAKRKRGGEEAEGEDEEEEGKTEESNTPKRRTYSAAHAVPASSSSAPTSVPTSLPSSSSSPTTPPCNHPGLSCVHVPQQRTIISGEAITDADFDLFLRHLYFCAFYRFPPFLPADDLDLTSTPPPATTLPPYPPLTEQMTSTMLRTRIRQPPTTPTATNSSSSSGSGGSIKLVWNEALMTLGQYFDCEALLARCEAVGMRRLEHVRHAGAYFDVLYAHQYGLREWKRRCIELILTDKRMGQRKEYALTVLWQRQLLLDILVAANARLQEGGRGKEEMQELDKAELTRAVKQVVGRLHAE